MSRVLLILEIVYRKESQKIRLIQISYLENKKDRIPLIPVPRNITDQSSN